MSHGHVQLVERTAGDRSDAREMVPAEQVGPGEWRIVGTPGLVNGCAAGDQVRVRDDGTFEVVERGGNVAAHLYSRIPLDETELLALRAAYAPLDGLVEWPPHQRFVVITVPVAAGFPAIEGPVAAFVDRQADAEWYLGNVFDEAGEPLDWWT